MDKSIIIIGAGIAGLSAGCYGQMNGYRTQIFELHDKPGGLCTSWERKGYTFDGCIHWLVGSRPGSGLNRIWQELGALQGRQIVDHDEFLRVEKSDGRTFVVHTDVDRLEQHMRELSPADTEVIEEFTGTIRRLTGLSAVAGAYGKARGPLAWIKTAVKMIPQVGVMMRYGKVPLEDFAARFTSPLLREGLTGAFDLPDCPVVALMMTLAWMHSRDAGYPVGGSLAFSRAIEQRYLDLGGEIHYKSRVEKILVAAGRAGEPDRATGVRLADAPDGGHGAEHPSEIVISAADGHATLFDMLDGKYLSDELRRSYEEWPIFPPLVQVSLGVARDLSAEPYMIAHQLEEPLTVAGKVREKMSVKHYCYDPTLAPAGKSVVVVMFESDYDYWKALSEERERYDAEKKEIAIGVIGRLERRFPGISDQVEVVDVATPLTTERYTGNWRGSMEGWLPTTKNLGSVMRGGMRKTLPGLENFYMVGQWVEPGGGVPPAATSGRNVMKMICKQDGRAFETRLP